MSLPDEFFSVLERALEPEDMDERPPDGHEWWLDTPALPFELR